MTSGNKNQDQSEHKLTELRDRVSALEKENKDLKNSLERQKKAGEIPGQLVNLSFDSFFVHVDNEIKFISETGAKLFGASDQEQIVGKDLMDFIHSDFRESIRNKQKKLYEGGQKGSPLGETKLLRLDGEPVDVEAAGVICDYQGQKAILVVLRDISERKKAEEKVKLMALFAELNPAPVLRCGLDGVVQMANPASRKIFKTGIVGEPVTSILPGIDEKEISKCIHNNSIISFTTFIGESAFQFTIKGSSEAGVAQIYGSDITERKKAEVKIKQTLGELETLLETASVGIFLVRDGKVEWVNRKCKEIFGYSSLDEMKDRTPYSFLARSSELDAAELEPRDKILAEGGVYHTELDFSRKDGSTFWGRVQSKAIDPRDLSKGRILVIEDFSDRKKMEDDLRRAKEQAEEATKLKDQFVSLVSHDLRSPFSSIIGFLRILDSDADQSLSENQKDIVNRVLKSGENLITMIDQLLDISRLQTGKITLESRFIDGRAIASMVIDEIESIAEKKSIKIVNDVPEKTRLYADFDLFSEVLRNLLSNAVKFCGEGDVVTMFTPNGSKTTLSVKDTGAGVNESILPDIFKHEVKTSTKGTLGEVGTGLGLPFSHDIMKAHDGGLTVESFEGDGTVFSASLPEVYPKVLIVDDEENSRFLQKQYLSGIGVETLEAKSGEEAVAFLEKAAPHLIILNMIMSGMGGLKLLERVKMNPRTKSIPVIMVTSGADIENREKAFQLKADDYISKPLQKEDFIPRVRRFVG